MKFNADHSNRRTLTFPVVKPCESISYSTLINSLISLCSTISTFNSRAVLFTSNKRNAKNALRFIGLLGVFLEEIKDGDFKGKSVISPLCDIHVVLQEILGLFHDLTRRDARAWVLLRSEDVAGRFRAGFGLMVGAVARIPEVVFGGCDVEVRECVDFLTRQVKRVGFGVESGDVWALGVVGSTLGRFERRVIPDPSELRRVMGYLDIKTWSECDDQVRFLENENGLFESGLESTMRLLGLMAYCRCVLFDHIDGNNINNNRKIEENKCEYVSICESLKLDDFKCPISLEVMVDPVTISTGHTYDRSSILKWFKSGNPVCPKTGQKVQSLDLVPNVAIKSLIKQYCLENGVPLPSVKAKYNTKNGANDVGSLVVTEIMKMVAGFLSIKLALGTMAEKSKAVYEIRLLTKRSTLSRVCFVECGVIPYLLNLILAKDSTTQENSMAALLNLSKHSESRPIIVNNGGLGLVVGVLRNGVKIEARHHASAVLFYLSSVEEYRRLIGSHPDAIPSLVELIRVGGGQGRKNALAAVFSLLMLPSNHCRVLEGRLVPLLITLLGSQNSTDDLIVDSLAVLSALAEKHEGAKAILRTKAVDTIVKVLCSSSSESSRLRGEHCTALLLALCVNGGREVVAVLGKNTSLMGALYSLLIEGTFRATKKAKSLINILHEFSERSSIPSMPRALPHENFIHVW
ncbi:hypothetical protein RND81_07G193100 [Saponaria officinalis]|uniref:RING-type E3 ubiquitin transferase n=1 Tax=Saponaria officinalis TaxID=3572 RepID=A0AAW1JS92_SAPOF